jgi:monoamine oxidase
MHDAAEIPRPLDVAIVGGGISGLYAAWRFTASKPGSASARSIALFESSPRWGGRIDTTPVPPLGPGAAVELGPMRFTPSMQIVSSLLRHLNLAVEKFPGIALRQLYVRGTDVAFGASGPTNLPYRLAEGESSNPVDLAQSVIRNFVPNAFELEPDQWEPAIRSATFQGRPVYEWGFWNIAESVASDEAYNYLETGFGLQSAMSNVNAAMAVHAVAVPLRDSVANEVYRPVAGWGGLVEALLAAMDNGPQLRLQHRLREMERHDSGFRLRFDTPEGEQVVDAAQVILAMPKRSLELIDLSALMPRARLHRLLDCISSVPVFKLCLAYEQPWWQKLKGWSDGFSVTDMPARQVYYGIGVGGSAEQNARVLMAGYCDLNSTEFWAGLARLGEEHTFSEAGGHGRRASLIAAANRQLRTLLGAAEDPPAPVWLGFADWSRDPFGGGWHEWRPGIDVLSFIPRMRQPFGDDTRLYVCGEAFSFFQGWIEGALMSAERLLEDRFHLARPGWIPQKYPLGP